MQLSEFRNKLQGLKVAIKTDYLDIIGKNMEKDVIQSFADKKAVYNGKTWAPRKDNLKHPLLRKTQAMFNSIKVKRGDSKVSVSTNGIAYAGIHQNSGVNDKGRFVPMRQFLPKASDTAYIENLLRKSLASFLKGYFKR